LLNTRFDKKRGERKIKKINTLKTHRNSDDDIISNVEKILTRQIKRHQKRSSTMIGVSHMSDLSIVGIIIGIAMGVAA